MSCALRLSRLLNSGLRVAATAGSSSSSSTSGNLLKNSAKLVQQTSSASLVTVANQKDDPRFADAAKVKPWPYKKRRYTWLYKEMLFLDPTQMRFTPNSKIITVDGNIGSGKEEVAKRIADEFGMLYMPEPRLEDWYINHQGFDYRTLNQYIEPLLHAIDEKMFYENPRHKAVPYLKYYFYKLRYEQYTDALAHMFNTGQGVVLERSPFSDFVFVDAMYENGWIQKDANDYHFRLRYDTIHELLRPHMVVYLDRDVDNSMKTIKDRNIPYQVNSEVLTPKYLSTIESSYKDKYLPDIGQFSELMIFKWNDQKPSPTTLNDMILEISNTNIDEWDWMGLKFKDWNFYMDSMYANHRYTYTTQKSDLLDDFVHTPIYDTDTMDTDQNDIVHRLEVYKHFVKNYALWPCADNTQVSFLGTIFNTPSYWEDMKFQDRAPWY